MLEMRKVALRVLPLLVVVWATIVMAGGAVYLVNKADDGLYDSTAKAGLGLCAVSVAILTRSGVRRANRRLWARVPVPVPTLVRPSQPLRAQRKKPPPTGPPSLQLLQVSRT